MSIGPPSTIPYPTSHHRAELQCRMSLLPERLAVQGPRRHSAVCGLSTVAGLIATSVVRSSPLDWTRYGAGQRPMVLVNPVNKPQSRRSKGLSTRCRNPTQQFVERRLDRGDDHRDPRGTADPPQQSLVDPVDCGGDRDVSDRGSPGTARPIPHAHHRVHRSGLAAHRDIRAEPSF